MFKARMTHTEKSCLRLAKAQNTCYGRSRNIVRLILAAVPFTAGYAIGLDTTVGVLFIVSACFFYYKTSFMYERDAKRAFGQTPEQFLDVEYDLDEESIQICSGGVKKRAGYSSLYALVSDRNYAYLFINKQQAYMIDFQTLVPDETEAFCGFLSQKTGLGWKVINIVERPSLIDFLKGNRETDW